MEQPSLSSLDGSNPQTNEGTQTDHATPNSGFVTFITHDSPLSTWTGAPSLFRRACPLTFVAPAKALRDGDGARKRNH